MKKTLNRNNRLKTVAGPAPARAGARRPRRFRVATPAAPEAAPVETEAPAAEPAEPVNGESLGGDALQLYLREIGRVKLLTPAEEIELARRIRRGDKKAREEMIKANLRLVVKIARDYDNMGLPLLDLINEGNIGLMKGVERFDPRKGAKLSTYASWWIKQSIKRALGNQSKTIRLPIHVIDKVAHIRKAELKLREAFDRDPTDEELAEEVGLSPRRIREYRQASKAPVSLDAPMGDSDDHSTQIAEVVADANAATPFDRLASETDNELLQEVLMTLDPRESEILVLRFGLNNEPPQTLEEVGERFGVTRERIRQIQDQALKKLRTKIEKRDSPSVDTPPLAVAA